MDGDDPAYWGMFGLVAEYVRPNAWQIKSAPQGTVTTSESSWSVDLGPNLAKYHRAADGHMVYVPPGLDVEMRAAGYTRVELPPLLWMEAATGKITRFPDADTSTAPQITPESRARETISDLLHGKVRPQTVSDLGDAVARAKQNGAVGKLK